MRAAPHSPRSCYCRCYDADCTVWRHPTIIDTAISRSMTAHRSGPSASAASRWRMTFAYEICEANDYGWRTRTPMRWLQVYSTTAIRLMSLTPRRNTPVLVDTRAAVLYGRTTRVSSNGLGAVKLQSNGSRLRRMYKRMQSKSNRNCNHRLLNWYVLQ